MKTGEKAAIAVVGLLVIGMVAFGITYEPEFKQTPEFASDTPDTHASGATAQASRAIPQDITAGNLPDPESNGAKSLVLYCVQCHDLAPPTMHNAGEWQAVLARMQRYMAERRGGMLIRLIRPPEKAWQELSEYLTSHALLSLPAPTALRVENQSGKAFLDFCSQCHSAPDPTRYPADTWQNTVARMVRHMRHANKRVPDAPTSAMITDYLAQYSPITPPVAPAARAP